MNEDSNAALHRNGTEMSYPPPPPHPEYRQYYQQQPQRANTNVLAIISFISAFFLNLLAVVLGHVALSQIKRTGERGSGFAIAGLVLGYLGLAFGLLIVIGIASSASSYTSPNYVPYTPSPPAATQQTMVTLADMQGKPLREAEARATDSGLKYNVVSPDGSIPDDPENWEVTSQLPAGGTSVAEGSSVTFSVKESAAVKQVSVPDLRGMTATKAKAAMKQAGLKIDWNKKVENGNNWIVSRTSPGPDQLVDPGTTIQVYVKRPAGYVSPNSGGDVPGVFKDYFAQRSATGVVIAEAVTSVTFEDGVVTVIFDPDASGIDRDTFEYINPYENLAEFAATPIAFTDTTGNRVRPLIKEIRTQYPDGTSLGSLDHAGILALNELDK